MVRVYVESYGCIRNKVDGEIMEVILFRVGYELVESLESVDYVVVNICVVKDLMEYKMVRRICELFDFGKKVIVIGCFVYVNLDVIDFCVFGMFGVKSIDRIVEVIDFVECGGKLVLVEGWKERKVDKFELLCFWKLGVVFVVLISEGCFNVCIYCVIRFVCGVFKSYKFEFVLKWVKEVFVRGYKEI